ncbi:MAG: DinB family protein [Chloroflexota bacterium]|nr:DinB family protein [Chloroflexota bacterium]
MRKKPTFAVLVADLTASVEFYSALLGLHLEDHDPNSDTATIVDGLGMPVLLAGPGTMDLAPYMGGVRDIAAPGTALYFHEADIDARMQRLVEAGLSEVQLVERRWGERRLVLRDPDGYEINLWAAVARTPQATLALYMQAPHELQSIMMEIGEGELDLLQRPGGWTIRQIVHHLADADAMQLPRIKMALAEPGRTWVSNAYSPQGWSDSVDYARMAVGASVNLFVAIREHVAELLQHLPPEAWERYTVNAHGERTSVGSGIGMLASHALEHIDEIIDIRRVHADQNLSQE